MENMNEIVTFTREEAIEISDKLVRGDGYVPIPKCGFYMLLNINVNRKKELRSNVEVRLFKQGILNDIDIINAHNLMNAVDKARYCEYSISYSYKNLERDLIIKMSLGTKKEEAESVELFANEDQRQSVLVSVLI